jgi:hypothetical protein
MGIIYTASGTVALAAAGEFISLEADATNPYVIHSCRIGQFTDPADAEAEMLQVRMVRYTGAQGATGGVAATESPHEVGMPASGAVGHVGSTAASATPTTIMEDSFNVQVGYLYIPTPEEHVWCVPGNGIAFVCVGAPNDSITITASITYEELMLAA